MVRVSTNLSKPVLAAGSAGTAGTLFAAADVDARLTSRVEHPLRRLNITEELDRGPT